MLSEVKDVLDVPSDPFLSVPLHLQRLYDLRDKQFFPTAEEKAQHLQTLVNRTLAAIPDPNTATNEKQRALLHYFRGKTLDALPDYQKEAEMHLSKAVKMDPELVDGWICLAHSHWKNNAIEQVLQCYRSAAAVAPQHKVVLREWSRVLRLAGRTAEQRTENVKAALEKAKQALQLDIQDGVSWYYLGLVYLAVFSWLSRSVKDIEAAVKAFQQATQRGEAESNPDLRYNRAVALGLLGRYEEAHGLYGEAFALDPSLTCGRDAMISLEDALDKARNAAQNRGGLKLRDLQRRTTAIVQPGTSKSVRGINFKALGLEEALTYTPKAQGGPRSEITVLSLYILNQCTPAGATPHIYAAMDATHQPCVVTVFYVTNEAIKDASEVWIDLDHCTVRQSDHFNVVRCATRVKGGASAEGDVEGFTFTHILVHDPTTLHVNGRPLSRDRIQTPSLSHNTFTT